MAFILADIGGFFTFEMTKKPEKQTEPFCCMKKTNGQQDSRKNLVFLKGIRETDHIEPSPTVEHSTMCFEGVKGSTRRIANSPNAVIPA